MKKFANILFALLAAIVCALGLVACGGGDTPTEITVSLDQTVVGIERNEEITLHAKVEGGSANVEWSVSGDAATVNDGVVRGVKAGNATVTAKAGDATASCEVTVTDTGDVPILTLDRTELQLQFESSLTVTAQIKYKGKPVTTTGLTWTSGNPELVSVTPVEGTASAEIKSIGGVGKTTVTVSCSYNGINLTEMISVEAVDDVVLQLFSLPLDGGKYHADLILSTTVEGMDETTLDTKADVAVTVYVNKEEKPDAQVSWNSTNENVAKYESGKIVAVGAGNAEITAVYSQNDVDYTAVVSVNVSRPVVRLSERTDVEKTGSDANKFTLSKSLEAGENIVAATIGGVSVFKSANAKIVTLEADVMSSFNYGENTITVTTDKVQYVCPILYITRAISDKTELDEIFHPAGNVDTESRTGYFVLDKNIMYGESNNAAKWNNCFTLQSGFAGVFDGRGYYIDGVKIDGTDCGFFVGIATGGVVKNVSFTNALFGGETYTYGGFLGCDNYGTIENVYISMNYDATGPAWQWHTGGLVSTNEGTVKHCFVDIETVGVHAGMGGGNNDNSIVGGIRGGSGTANGVIVVGVNEKFKSTTASSEYKTFAELLAANIDFTSWYGEFWKQNGLLPLPEKVQKADITASINNTETIVAQGGSLTLNVGNDNRYVVLSLKNAIEGVTIEGTTLKVAESVDSNAQITVVATPVYGSGATAEKTFTVTGGQTLTEVKAFDVELYGNGAKTITLSDENKDKVRGNLSSVKYGTTELAGCTYENGVLTLNGIETLKGEQSLTVVFEEKSGGTVTYTTTLNLSAVFITRIINDKTELDEVFHPTSGGVDVSGYYVLGGNITYNGNWSAVGTYNNNDSWFAGTLDGRGYKIDAVTITGGDAGFFTCIATSGVMKNIIFTNAVFGNDVETVSDTHGGFIATEHWGTLENVYVSGKLYATGNNWNMSGMFVRANDGYIRNCVVNVTEYGTHAGSSGGGSGATESVSTKNGVVAGIGWDYQPAQTSNFVAVGYPTNVGVSAQHPWEYKDWNSVSAAIKNDFDASFWTIENGALIPKALATSAE